MYTVPTINTENVYTHTKWNVNKKGFRKIIKTVSPNSFVSYWINSVTAYATDVWMKFILDIRNQKIEIKDQLTEKLEENNKLCKSAMQNTSEVSHNFFSLRLCYYVLLCVRLYSLFNLISC